eukprot:6174827-Pleurochrysis_carterae.AAC.1
MTAERRYDFEPWSVGTDQLDTPFEIRVQDINFRLSSDAQIAACGVAILAAVKHEARALRDSLITRSLVETCILEQNTLSDAMATILTSKICSDELPGSQGRKALLELRSVSRSNRPRAQASKCDLACATACAVKHSRAVLRADALVDCCALSCLSMLVYLRTYEALLVRV